MVSIVLSCCLLSVKFEARIFRSVCVSDCAAVASTELRNNLPQTPATAYVIEHDFEADVEGLDLIECVQAKYTPPFLVCVYPSFIDVYVSQALRSRGSWEAEISDSIMTSLQSHPDAGFLDIGANIGAHSLRAAAIGRSVVMIEPLQSNVKRLHKSVNINGMTSRVRLFENAVCDSRSHRMLHVTRGSLGGNTLDRKLTPGEIRNESVTCIRMDDVTSLLPFTTAIMKIDIEGWEHRAFVHAEHLLTRVDVPVIYMEWVNMKRVLSDSSRTADAVLIERMLTLLTTHSYTPHSLVNESLDITQVSQWPFDVVWYKNKRNH